MVSYRLGGPDGVSVEAAKWAAALHEIGFAVTTVAGAGTADIVLPPLALDATTPPDAAEVERALASRDLVVIENMCSLPLNPLAGDAVAGALRGRRAILHHHDLAWQRERYATVTGIPPTDPAWAHVTINELSRRQLAQRGIAATTIPNCFDVDAPPGRRDRTRDLLGVGPVERLLLHPTRAIPRKNIPAALALAEALKATYWLLGPADDGFGPELVELLARAQCRVVRRLPPGCDVIDAYAASDAVTLPSEWEGFGNATVESAVHRRPLAIGDYPVARELVATYGFRWFPTDDPTPLRRWLDDPDPALLDHNQGIAREHFSPAVLRRRLAELVG